MSGKPIVPNCLTLSKKSDEVKLNLKPKLMEHLMLDKPTYELVITN